MKKKITPEEQHKIMLETPVARLVISLSLPTVASQLMTVIYNTADTWFVAKIGTGATAAVGVVFSVMSIIQAFGYGISMGTGALISLNLGEKKDEEAVKYASSGLFISFFLGLAVDVLGLITLSPLMKILGATQTMLPYCTAYAKYIFIGAPIMCSSFVLNGILRSEGEATLSMIGLCSGGILNMILDPVLIFVLKMGIAGAAVATVLSQLFSFILLLIPFLNGRSIVKLKPAAVSKKAKTYLLIISTGLPTVFRQSLGSVSSALLTRTAGPYGDAAIAAVTVANKIYMLVRNLVIGLGQGFIPVAGYNFGAGNKKRTKKAFLCAVYMGSALCIVCTVITFFFPGQLISLFRDDAMVVEAGSKMLRFFCISMPVLAYSTFVNQLYQSLGFKAKATFLASCRQGIFFIPLIFLLSHFFGLSGIEATQAMSDFMTFLVSIPFQIMFFRKQLKEVTPVEN